MKANNLKELSKSATELQLTPCNTPRLQLVSPRTLHYLGQANPGESETLDKYK